MEQIIQQQMEAQMEAILAEFIGSNGGMEEIMGLMGINGGLEEIMSLAGMTGNIYEVNELSYLVSFRRNGRNAEWPGGRNGGYDDRNGRYDDRNGRRHGAVYE